MLDPKLFTVERILGTLLDNVHGNRDRWRMNAEIVPNYMPPFPSANTEPVCVVRYGAQFLRYSRGPLQGHLWDSYGDDYQTPELALLALMEAPVPPHILKRAVWASQEKASDDGE